VAAAADIVSAFFVINEGKGRGAGRGGGGGEERASGETVERAKCMLRWSLSLVQALSRVYPNSISAYPILYRRSFPTKLDKRDITITTR
jgi:hypothetical protein